MSDLATMLDAEARPARFAGLDDHVDLAVVLVNYNTAHLLKRCISKLREASGGLSVRVVIVDNASRDNSAHFIRENFPDCVLVANQENIGFGRANNQALEYCGDACVLLLNTDAFVFDDTLIKCLSYMRANPRCGVLGATLLDETLKTAYTGRAFPSPWANFLLHVGLVRPDAKAPRSRAARPPNGAAWHCDWVVGCFYMIRREVLDQVGLFDPRYFLYFEEVDHCRAVKEAGWTVECLADASVIHVGGASAASDGELTSGARQLSALQIESELLYYRKHNGLIGLLLTVFLALLADSVRATKGVARGRGMSGIRPHWRNAELVCRLFWQTRRGTRATR